MKRKIIIILLIFFVIGLVFYIRPALYYLFNDHINGFYEPITNTLICDAEFMCLHEQGHKIDDEHGWISRTQEFKTAFEKYSKTYNGNRVKEYLDWYFSISLYHKVYSKFSYYQEVYAEIYQVHGGRIEWMPEYLQEFYIE
jgi:hypothetical protein